MDGVDRFVTEIPELLESVMNRQGVRTARELADLMDEPAQKASYLKQILDGYITPKIGTLNTILLAMGYELVLDVRPFDAGDELVQYTQT